jgi:hypothetical protein
LDGVKHLTKFGKLDDVVNGKAIYHVDLRNSKNSFSNALKPCLFHLVTPLSQATSQKRAIFPFPIFADVDDAKRLSL